MVIVYIYVHRYSARGAPSYVLIIEVNDSVYKH